MSGSLVQSVQISYSSSTATPASPSMTTTAGNSLVVICQCSASNSPSFSDGGDSFGSIVSAAEFTAGIKLFVAQNIAGGTTVINGSGGAFYGLWAGEVAGVGSIINSSGLGQNGPGNSANAVSSGAISITSAPAFMVGLSYNATGTNTSNSDTAPAAGTGFTGVTSVWNQHSGAGQNLATPAYGRILSTGSTPMTWSASPYGSDLYISVAVAFAELTSQPNYPANFNGNYSMPMLAI